jgi:RNA polymerase sigma factor (sigma-70 family)
MSETARDLEALVQAHWQEVYGMLLALTRKRSVAEDLAQEVFLLALKKRLQPGPQVAGWFKSAAWRLAMNELRRRQPLSRDFIHLQDLGTKMEPPGLQDSAPSFTAELAALRHCLDELNQNDHSLLAGRYDLERTLPELSTALGQTVGYLKQRLFRLRARLASCIRKRLMVEASGDA